VHHDSKVNPQYDVEMTGQKRNIHELIVRDKQSGELQVIDMYTGELISSSSKTIDENTFIFDYNTALLICQEVAKGRSIASIGNDPEFPPLHVINHWLRSDRMFREEMGLARKARAEYYHDQLAAITENAVNLVYSKDEAPVVKLASDNLKWLAEKNNPERYGPKVVHEGSTEKPIVMRVIDTGIRRKPIVETTAKEVYNESEGTRKNQQQSIGSKSKDADGDSSGTEPEINGEVG
jgi:hypothetical protein